MNRGDGGSRALFPVDVSATRLKIYMDDLSAGLGGSGNVIMIWKITAVHAPPFPVDVSATRLKIYMDEPSAGLGGSCSAIMIWKPMTASRATPSPPMSPQRNYKFKWGTQCGTRRLPFRIHDLDTDDGESCRCFCLPHVQFAQTSPGKINTKPFPADVSVTKLLIYMVDPGTGLGGSCYAIMTGILMTASRATPPPPMSP